MPVRYPFGGDLDPETAHVQLICIISWPAINTTAVLPKHVYPAQQARVSDQAQIVTCVMYVG
jgi:hypothetical protein